MTSWEPGDEPQAERTAAPFQHSADGIVVADLQPSGVPHRRGRNVWIGAGVAVLVTAMLTAAIIAASSSSPSFPDGTDAIARLRGAPASTTASGSARTSASVTMTIEGETRTIMKMKGSNDFRNHSASFFMTTGPASTKIRIVRGVEYFAQTIIPLPHGAQWVKITRADTGLTEADVASVGSQDPSAGLQFMQAVSGTPKLDGTETLDGIQVAHYKFTLDLVPLLDKLAKATDKLGASKVAKGMKKLESVADLRHLPAEAWLDGDGRVRRFVYRIEISANRHTAKEVQDMRFSKFGAPVTISVPPAADVIPLSQVPNLFKQLENSDASNGPAAS
jgi:hypothetical protein